MKTKTFNFKAALKDYMKANLIRLFVKEDNASYQDIYKQFMMKSCRAE